MPRSQASYCKSNLSLTNGGPDQASTTPSRAVVRESISVPTTDGETLVGWLYLPRERGGRKLPGIVTANAITAVKEINLPEFATRFAEAGFATLVLDYRYWGESTGEPRFHVAPMEFRADISAAVSYLGRRKEVDADRIGGWGISMGGPNMLFQATWESRIKAVASVSGAVGPRTDSDPDWRAAKARHYELVEAGKAERAARPDANIRTIQAFCPAPQPDCALPVKEGFDWYEEARQSFAPNWENKISSTSMQNFTTDDPTFAINLARASILFVHPAQDNAPIADVRFHYRRAPQPKRLVVPDGLHTSTYQGEQNFDLTVQESIKWFRRHLR